MKRSRSNSTSDAPATPRAGSQRTGLPRPGMPWQPRFGIREMLMLMLICGVLAAALGYLYQDEKGGGKSMRFIFLTVAAPTLMAMLMGIGFVSYELFKNRGRKKRRPREGDEF